MTIERLINGKNIKIKLTDEEICDIHKEYELKCAKEKIRHSLIDFVHGCVYDELINNDNLLNSAAEEYLNNKNEYGMDHESAVEDAIALAAGNVLAETSYADDLELMETDLDNDITHDSDHSPFSNDDFLEGDFIEIEDDFFLSQDFRENIQKN